MTERMPPLRDAVAASKALKGWLSPERITELAEAGYMPCYRIDGGSPLFLLDEVVRYTRQHLLRRTQAVPLPLAIPVQYPDARAPEPPVSLAAIPKLRWAVLTDPTSCVYFLVKSNVVVYVGQTTELTGRLISHHRDGKDFDHAFWLPVPRSELDAVEGAFIRQLRPLLNKRTVKGLMCAPSEHDDHAVFAAYTESTQ